MPTLCPSYTTANQDLVWENSLIKWGSKVKSMNTMVELFYYKTPASAFIYTTCVSVWHIDIFFFFYSFGVQTWLPRLVNRYQFWNRVFGIEVLPLFSSCDFGTPIFVPYLLNMTYCSSLRFLSKSFVHSFWGAWFSNSLSQTFLRPTKEPLVSSRM